MNHNMRRFLDEDWEDEFLVKMPLPQRKQEKAPAMITRRQQEKQRGREMAKFHRTNEKMRFQSKP